MTVYELLTESQELIRDPDKLCRDSGFACDANGNGRKACDPMAVKWCAIGIAHMVWARHKEFIVVTDAAMKRLRAACIALFPGRSLGNVNDGIGHEAVMKIYDLARQTEFDACQVKETTNAAN